MKNANPSTTSSLRYVLPLLSVLLFATLHQSNAQLATCNNDTSIANFGVNRTVYTQGTSSVDDWFRLSTATGVGQGVIGTTPQTAKPPMQISAAAFKTLIQGATTVAGRNRRYVQGMSVPSLTVWNNMLLLDAFAARDNMSSSGATDSTVFAGGGDKNADNPNTWSIGEGGVQQKSDIIDVAGHIRRDLNTGDLWCFTMASILSPGGDNFIDFEFYRSSPVISGGVLTNTGLASAGNHTPFILNSIGGIQSPGDVLAGLSYSLSAGSATMRIWINPNNVDGAGHDTAWFNQLPNRFFTFTGSCVFGLNSGSFGYAEIRSKTAGSCLVNSVVNSSSTPSGEWGTLGGSGATFSTSYVTEQMVEIAINFSDFGLDLNTVSGACFNVFGSLLVKTRSSSSLTSELKDFAGPYQFGNFTEVQASAGTDAAINCANSTVTLNGSSLTPGAVYSWTTPNGHILMGGNTFSPTVDQPGTYILTVASPSIATCVTSDTVIITLDTIRPQANAGSDWTYDCSSTPTRTLSGSSTTSGVNPVWTALNGGNIINDAATFNPVVSSSGCYVLTVTNPVNFCFASDTVCAIAQTDVPVVTATQVVQPSCNASCNASISLNVSGASGPYTFQWSDGQTVQNRTGLCAGTYEVTVTSSNGCTATYSTSLVEPDVLQASAGSTVANVSCFGGNNGSVSISAIGGTTPYTGAGTFSGLAAGNYSYTISDANGCTSSISVNITEPTALTISLSSTTDVACNGDSSGVLVIASAGGVSPYTYLWNTNSTDSVLNNATAGLYNVTVTDANGCSQSASYTLSEPALALSATAINTNVGCNNGSTGAVDVTPVGGTAPYSYSWSTGATTEDISNLTAGAYIVTIVDANGCQYSSVFNIDEPQSGLAATNTVSAVACNGNATGQIDLQVSGGTQPYSFQWSNGSTLEDLTGLSSGTYTVTVTDANNCLYNEVISVTEPVSALNASVNTTAVACFGGNNGQIDLQPAGGTSPYSYQWSNGSTDEDQSSLTSGSYDVVITDSNGCTYNQTVVVNEPTAAISATAATVNVGCNAGATGQIDLTVSGGTAPYTFSWSNGSTDEDLLNIIAGQYTVVVTDANNCTYTQTIDINQPGAGVSASVSVTNVDCNGSSSGQIDLTTIGGTAPYIYQWNNGVITEDQSGVVAGTYTVVITDANNCVFTTSVVIDEPVAALSASPAVTDVACQGDASGSIDITAAGGTAPYTYQWNNGSSNEDLNGLTAGTYDVVVTDDNGCTFAATYTINEPSAPLGSSNTVTNVDCYGNASGQIDLSVSGGTAPYTYQWNNGSTTEDQPALAAGTYTVLITDANNCTSSASVTIGEPASALTASSSVNAVACNGDATGQIDLTPTGGTAPYTYSWNNGASTEDIINLNAGTYTVTVTDVNGCTTIHVVQVTQPQNAIQANGTATPADCINGVLGSATVAPTGGTAPFSYQWNTGAASAQIANLIPGTYQVTVTDANGCTANQTLTVADNSTLTIQANGSTEICVGDSATISAPLIANATYQWLFNGAPLQGANNNTFITPANGTYQVVVTTSCGPYTSNPVTITLRTVDNVSITNDVIICTGETTQLEVTGGTSWSWSPAGNLDDPTSATPVASPRQTTTYVVTIQDDYGCTTTASVTVTVECDTLNIPNGFSPNGDGKNDTFVIDGLEQYPGTVLTIFNRWGNMVYKQKDYANQWNGTSNVGGTVGGNELPNGTYYYIVDLNKGEKPLSGFVVIRR